MLTWSTFGFLLLLLPSAWTVIPRRYKYESSGAGEDDLSQWCPPKGSEGRRVGAGPSALRVTASERTRLLPGA